MPIHIKTFGQALAETDLGKRHVLLGNGFSKALFPDRFRYGSLLEEADFANCPIARRAFDELDTTDFEVVIKALRNAIALLPLYSTETSAETLMREHAEALKEPLVQAIAGRHPERPSDITEEQYGACRAFLAHFVGQSRDLKPSGGKDRRGCIYTLNYDLLLYWTLLHNQVIHWGIGNPLSSVFERTEALEHDDGFRARCGSDSTLPRIPRMVPYFAV